MAFQLSDIEEAYIKLKSYIFYDNTDILLRQQLVEFETNTTKDINSILVKKQRPYASIEDVFDLDAPHTVREKLKILTHEINNFHIDNSFFNYFLDKIDVSFYPKKLEEKKKEENFITNKRVEDQYKVERVTAFASIPIELHILSVLWILKTGKNLDAQLKDNSLGNRLLLNKEKDSVVQGSGLFKPYFKQYQKWRDESVSVAKNLLDNGRDVAFLNLDIRDFFHSVRISSSKLYDGRKNKSDAIAYYYNMEDIFLSIHEIYTELVAKKYKVPYDFYPELSKQKNGDLKEVILPIGLLSSYVLANDYLNKFDQNIIKKIKPAYYGRYVDDILIVIADPNPQKDRSENIDFAFEFDDYKMQVNSSEDNEEFSFEYSELSQLEKYVLETFYPIIKLVDSPAHLKNQSTKRCFKLNKYASLYCQSDKSLLYHFDHTESDLVIDKLKKELDERTSEFRDLPDEQEDLETFEESAYHLLYDGTDGKIRTLKDYKEDRYGLTIYLTNKTFAALRHDKKISETEKKQILSFFRGSNCINFYRLWERIFTFLLVNDQPNAYVNFYLHCAEQIIKIRNQTPVQGTKVDYNLIQNTLIEYLDCSHELALSLNPNFIKSTRSAAREFEIQLNKLGSNYMNFFVSSFEPTQTDSFWLHRFRRTNMVRHQYIIHPLLSYTKKSKNGNIDLTSLKNSIFGYDLDDELLVNSPRPIKFWECCLSACFQEISEFDKSKLEKDGDYILTDILGTKHTLDETENRVVRNNYLDRAFNLYKKGNTNHIPSYILDKKEYQDNFFVNTYESISFDHVQSLTIQEIRVNTDKSNALPLPTIAFANTQVEEDNIVASIRSSPNLSIARYKKLSSILKKARAEKANILLFPECFVPINLLSSIVRYSEKNQILTISGLEHVVVDETAFNFITTILPTEVNGIKDAVVLLRLKNHYSHAEELLIQGHHLNVPKPVPYRHDIICWRNIYLTSYYCFELANALHRSLFKGKIDLLVGVEWNKDTPYFSNIVESVARDLHAFIAQVNTSQFGDSRLTQPVETANRDILRLKGGLNDAILNARIDIPALREFQRKKFALTHSEKVFKPLPPDFQLKDVLKRINNEFVFSSTNKKGR